MNGGTDADSSDSATGFTRTGDDGPVAMVAPGGWRVVPISVERGGRQLRLYRVTRNGIFIGECRTPAEVSAAGVPLDELAEEGDSGPAGDP